LQWIEPDGIHLNTVGHSWIHNALQHWPPLLNWAGLSPLKTPTPISV
jgi:hypothetical protein